MYEINVEYLHKGKLTGLELVKETNEPVKILVWKIKKLMNKRISWVEILEAKETMMGEWTKLWDYDILSYLNLMNFEDKIPF